MKLWLVAFGAIAVIAARAVYSISTRQSRRRNRFNDQVSSEWLATAKIHEDHPSGMSHIEVNSSNWLLICWRRG